MNSLERRCRMFMKNNMLQNLFQSNPSPKGSITGNWIEQTRITLPLGLGFDENAFNPKRTII